MNDRIRKLAEQAGIEFDDDFPLEPETIYYLKLSDFEKFAELIVRECAKELREAEQEANRAYKAKEVKERNTFDGYDFADMLEERFGVEE